MVSGLGVSLLEDDTVLRDKITAEGLNAVLAAGDRQGRSALSYIIRDEEQLLIDDAVLRGKITKKGLSALIASRRENTTIEDYLLRSEIGSDLVTLMNIPLGNSRSPSSVHGFFDYEENNVEAFDNEQDFTDMVVER